MAFTGDTSSRESPPPKAASVMGVIPWVGGLDPPALWGCPWGCGQQLIPAPQDVEGSPAQAFWSILGHFGANLIWASGRCMAKGYFRNCKCRHKRSFFNASGECEVKR